MANNRVPETPARIIPMATQMLAGLNSLGTLLGITQITPSGFSLALDDYIAAENSFNAGRSATQTASNAWIAAMEAVAAWLATTRGVLTGRFGFRYSVQWAQAGFTNNSTAVPRRLDQQLTLIGSLAAFFEAHPTYEVSGMQVTALRADTLRTAANTAKTALDAAEASQVTIEGQRSTAQATLTAQMRLLIGILKSVLTPDDARWLNFGLNIPASNTTPGQPLNLTVSLESNDDVVLACRPVPLAQRYRWRMRIVGQQEEYGLAASSVPPLAVIKTVQPGQTVEFIVQAVNGGSQGVASEPVIYTKPALAAAAAAAPAPAREAREPKAAAPRPLPHRVRPAAGNGHATRAR